jgi:nonsense-mediated mRNA decay protein 3
MDKGMFCVECGRECTIFKEGVCTSCYLKTHKFTKGPDVIDIPVCTNCESYKIKNIWTSDLFSDLIRRVIRNNFQISKELEKVDISADCKDKLDGKSCKVSIYGFLEGLEISEEHNLLVRLKRTICDVCSKQYGGYYEAIIQVRADGRKLDKKDLEDIKLFVENLVEVMIARGNRSLFISDMGEEHGGYDFYLSDKSAAMTITNKIQEQYGGEIRKSSKDMGLRDSRRVCRMTYLIRLPIYKKGDFVNFINSFYYVKAISGKKIIMVNLSNWDELTFELKTIQKARNLGGTELVKEAILISQTKDEIQIMDSKTYKTFEIKKPKKINFDKKALKIIKINENIFLYPL